MTNSGGPTHPRGADFELQHRTSSGAVTQPPAVTEVPDSRD